MLIIHNLTFLGSFFRAAHMAKNWISILEIKLRHPLSFLLCICGYRKGISKPDKKLLQTRLILLHFQEAWNVGIKFIGTNIGGWLGVREYWLRYLWLPPLYPWDLPCDFFVKIVRFWRVEFDAHSECIGWPN